LVVAKATCIGRQNADIDDFLSEMETSILKKEPKKFRALFLLF
jgi:hypothetical protein